MQEYLFYFYLMISTNNTSAALPHHHRSTTAAKPHLTAVVFWFCSGCYVVLFPWFFM
jgi:hypothetical protein